METPQFDLYEVIERRDTELVKIKRQIQMWEATEKDAIMLAECFQNDINQILAWNSQHDNM